MLRTYSPRISALITGADPKWLDNLLSRHDLPGVSRARRGVERRITEDGLLAIELCRILNLELGVSVQQAATIVSACNVFPGEDVFQFRTASGLMLQLPILETRSRLRERTIEAVEMVAAVRRGRPRLS